ncbi:MAG: sulfite exporter TauE/SafE family protein, partial [Archangium sp.]
MSAREFIATAGLPVLGLVCGLVVGMTSTGGGSMLTPGLILLGVPPTVAVGTDLLIASVMKLFGGGIYALRGEVHWPTVRRLAYGSLPGALAGVWLLNRLSAMQIEQFLQKSVGMALLLAGGAMLLRMLWRPGPTRRPLPQPWVTVLLGLAVGVLVSVTTIGSGSLLLCVLV